MARDDEGSCENEGMDGLINRVMAIVARSDGNDTAWKGRDFGGNRGNNHSAAHMHEEKKGKKIRRVRWCARQSLQCIAMCTCNGMERHVCTAVTALWGWFGVLEGATTRIPTHMHRAAKKLYDHQTHQ